MNFKDAAIKVLTESKKPLHYKKITSIALANSLLDFLGASPEKRMLESLKLEVKNKDSLVSVIRPGFFILKKYHNKNLKKKDGKPKKRIEILKENNKEINKGVNDIENISLYSMQIYSKQYFTKVIPKEEQRFRLNNKEEIPKYILKYIEKRRKVKYYTVQEIIYILEKENFFDISKISPSSIIPLINKFNKSEKNDLFFIKNDKIIPYSLLESLSLFKNTELILKELENRRLLLNKEIVNWFNRLNFGQFQKFSKILLEKLGLYNLRGVKGFSDYYFITKKLGLSELNFILLLKKGKELITKQNIIEARGVLSRFGYGNLIILTSSRFDTSAIEETKLNGTNIVLMDKFFIFDAMNKFEIGILKDNLINKIDYDFFLSL